MATGKWVECGWGESGDWDNREKDCVSTQGVAGWKSKMTVKRKSYLMI